MASVNKSEIDAKIAQCAQYFAKRLPRGHCNCFNDNSSAWRVEDLMRKQQPSSRLVDWSAAGAGSSTDTASSSSSSTSGGLGVIMRGHALRGVGHDSHATRLAAQLECSESVRRHIIEPFVRLGVRVHVYLTVYDTTSEEMLRNITQPYRNHIVAVTTLSAEAAGQLLGLANAINAFETMTMSRGSPSSADPSSSSSSSPGPALGPYDAVVVVRLDLRLKVPFTQLLLDGTSDVRVPAATAPTATIGTATTATTATWLAGVRFAWREIGGGWRSIFNPAAEMLERVDNGTRREMLKVVHRMAGERSVAFQPRHWMLNDRIADTIIAWGGGDFASCVRQNVMVELTRGWRPEKAPSGAYNDVGHHMLWQLRNAFGVPKPRSVDVATTLPHGYYPFIGFLFRHGQYDSNPCGGVCMLNPVYDILPRQQWTVQSEMCTRFPDDFAYDSHTSTYCCPSAEYCCPNSITNCTHAEASGLYDASAVSDELLGRSGWLRHFASRFRSLARPDLTICGADGSGTHRCAGHATLTLTPQSVERVQEVWRRAPWNHTKYLPEDDDNCRMSHIGRCAANGRTKTRDELGF